MENKNFKKVYLSKDQETIDGTITQMGAAAAVLNSFIFSVEEVLKFELSNDEKIQVKDNGIQFIKAKIKESFPFPLAPERFNLEAIGMLKIETLYETYQFNSSKWLSFNYVLNDSGHFEIDETERKNVIELYSRYTQNQKQNDALKLVNGLVELFDKAEDLGIISEYGRQYITQVCPVLDVAVQKEINERRIVVNNYKIMDIR